jgi:hypothetical protein
MQNTNKLSYEAPAMETWQMMHENVICLSNRYEGFGEEEEM